MRSSLLYTLYPFCHWVTATLELEDWDFLTFIESRPWHQWPRLLASDQKGIKKVKFGTKHLKKAPQKKALKWEVNKKYSKHFSLKSFLFWQSCATGRAGAGAAHTRGFTGEVCFSFLKIFELFFIVKNGLYMLENLKQNVVPHNCCWKRRVYITHWESTEHKNAFSSSPSLWIIKVLGRENYNKLEWNYSFTVTGQDDILILGVFCAATNIWCSARVPLSLLQSWERCLSSPLSGLQLMLIFALINFQPGYVFETLKLIIAQITPPITIRLILSPVWRCRSGRTSPSGRSPQAAACLPPPTSSLLVSVSLLDFSLYMVLCLCCCICLYPCSMIGNLICLSIIVYLYIVWSTYISTKSLEIVEGRHF